MGQLVFHAIEHAAEYAVYGFCFVVGGGFALCMMAEGILGFLESRKLIARTPYTG